MRKQQTGFARTKRRRPGMKTYGLIGYPLSHSFSERYFGRKFAAGGIRECTYTNFPLADIAQLPQLLAATPTLCGLNVTIPYKQAVIPYLTRLDDQAAQVGAVNCIRIENGTLTGYNTDIYGFRESLLQLIGPARPRALVLGGGGASKAVKYVLRQLGIPFQVVSRTKSPDTITYEEVTPALLAGHPLVVNTTPLGTCPAIHECPALPYEAITPAHFLFDVVYNPEATRFLALGKERGAATMNGMQMLVGQAEKSWEIWNR